MSDVQHTGLGVLIAALGGDAETEKALVEAKGKVIRSVSLHNDTLQFVFEDGSRLSLSDAGQSCCETRYLTCDEPFEQYAGAKLLEVSTAPAPDSMEGDSEAHEVQFLKVKTDRGILTAETHNEHNGYYGGFWIIARYYPKNYDPVGLGSNHRLWLEHRRQKNDKEATGNHA